MKIQLISAYFVVFLSLSLHAMEERENGSITLVWAEIIQPDSAAGVGINPYEEYPTDSPFFSPDIESPVQNSGFLTPAKEELCKQAHTNKLALELGLYLDQYTEDDTYGDIPANERRKFQDDEREWAKNSKSYYNRCKIYDIPSAKMRYDLMREHVRQKRNGRIGLAVVG
jgi:hypothetical protein